MMKVDGVDQVKERLLTVALIRLEQADPVEMALGRTAKLLCGSFVGRAGGQPNWFVCRHLGQALPEVGVENHMHTVGRFNVHSWTWAVA